VALPFTLKRIFRQKKKNYGNSNISPCKNYIIFKKSSKNKPKSFKIYYNSVANIKFSTQAKISSSKTLI